MFPCFCWLDNINFILISYRRRLFKRVSKCKKYSRLSGNPQARATVLKTKVMTPKKPNSARRPVAKVLLRNIKIRKQLNTRIPGKGFNIRKHSMVLIKGGGSRDLPGVSYSCIRGVYDFAGMSNKKKRRSIYATPKENKKMRRKYRILVSN